VCLFLETKNAGSFSLCEPKKGNLRELQAISFIQVSPGDVQGASLFHPLLSGQQKGKRNNPNKWNKITEKRANNRKAAWQQYSI
jgi:hypothetical protein